MRGRYHAHLADGIIRIKTKAGRDAMEYPNFADSGSGSSVAIAWGMVQSLAYTKNYQILSEQTIGRRFEELTMEFIGAVFALLHHMRPGKWQQATERTTISRFQQYEHLGQLLRIVRGDKTLSSVLASRQVSR